MSRTGPVAFRRKALPITVVPAATQQAGRLSEKGSTDHPACLYSMIFAIPSHEAVDANFDWRCRPKADIVHQIVDVRVGCRNISRLHRQQVLSCLFANGCLERLDEILQLDGLVIANVIDLVGSATGAWIGCPPDHSSLGCAG